jgi:hypothetical protein
MPDIKELIDERYGKLMPTQHLTYTNPRASLKAYRFSGAISSALMAGFDSI